MPKSRMTAVNERYRRLRERVMRDYGFPTRTSADAFIAQVFEEAEAMKSQNAKTIKTTNNVIDSVNRFLGGRP